MVVTEVLMVVDECEADSGKGTLEHVLGDAGGTQVVEATVDRDAIRGVITSDNTTFEHIGQAGLKEDQ